MKTLKLISSILLIAILSFSCSSSDDNNNAEPTCEEVTAKTASAKTAFDNATASNHTELCNAYKAALQNQINVCGDTSGALQAIITDLGDCTINTNPSKITVTIGTLATTFQTNLTVTTVGTTRKIKAYDDATLTDFVSFEIQQGVTGQDKISNFVLHVLNRDFTKLPIDEGGVWGNNVTVNTTNEITGTFYGYVTSLDNATLSLTQGVIDIDL